MEAMGSRNGPLTQIAFNGPLTQMACKRSGRLPPMRAAALIARWRGGVDWLILGFRVGVDECCSYELHFNLSHP